jgi:hypothetical protein
MFKKGGVVLILALLLGSFLIPSVNASGVVSITDTLFQYGTSYPMNNLDTSKVQLTTGELVFAYIPDSSDTKIRIYKIDSEGNIDGLLDYTYSASYHWIGVGVKYVSDTVIYLYAMGYYNAGNNRAVSGVVKLNPTALTTNTMIIAGSSIDLVTSGTYPTYVYFTSMVLYNAKYYYMTATEDLYPSTNNNMGNIELFEYTPDSTLAETNILAVSFDPANFVYPIYWFQDSDDSSICWATYSTSTTDMSYYKIDLAGKTSTLIAGMWNPVYQIDHEMAENSHFITGYTATNGTRLYLTFIWSQSTLDAGVPVWRVMQDKMSFDTSITSGNFDSHLWSVHEVTSGSYTSVTRPYWMIGYAENTTSVWLYYPSNTVGGNVLSTRHHITYSSILEDDSVSYVSVYPTTDPIPEHSDKGYSNSFDFLISYGIGTTATQIKVYYGLSAFLSIYTATVSCLPNDVPNLSQNKQYTFTVTVYKNGVVTQGLNVRFLSNAIEQTPTFKTTNVNGQVVYLVLFTQANVYDFDWEVYDPYSIYPTYLRYTLSGTYIVAYVGGTPSGDDPTDVIASVTTNSAYLMGTFIPAFIVVVGPAILFIPFGGAGMVLGLGVGAIIGLVTGLLPFYIIFILLLLVSIGLIMVFRTGISGGNKGEG